MKSLRSFGKFSQWHQLLCLGILWLAVVSIPTIYYAKEINKDSALSRTERQGLMPAQLMLDIIQRTQEHGSLTARFLLETTVDNNSAAKKERRAKAEDLEEAIVDLEDYTNKINNKNITNVLAKITADWHQISQRVTVREVSVAESAELHKALVRQQLNALQMILDSYQLSRDPEATGASLIGAGLIITPERAEILAQLRVTGATLLTQGEASYGDRVELRSLMLLSQAKLRELDSGISKFAATNSTVKETVQQSYAKTRESFQGLMGATQEEILSKPTFTLPADDYRLRFTQAIDNYYSFIRLSITQMDTLLKQRVEQQQEALSKFLFAVFAITAVVLLVSFWWARKLLRQVGAEPAYIINALQLMSRGDLKQNILAKQPGSIVAQVKKLQEKLRQEHR